MLAMYEKILVTGGAGFIGSHLVDELMEKERARVTVLDNFSSGDMANVERWLKDSRFSFVRGDLKNPADARGAVEGVDVVFHLAANPEVRVGRTSPSSHFEENLVATFNLLEAMRASERAKVLVLASTSTVYGEASVIPTPEDYGPLIPISVYGASKLACEALACSYAYTFGVRALIVRFANVVGSRSGHGVIVDFIRKLRRDRRRLEILGDGTQKKSYMHIDDCVSAFAHLADGFLRDQSRVDIFNIGTDDQVDVGRIAAIVAEEMKLSGVKFDYTGGVDGGRGWLGDVKVMHLSIKRLTGSGWKPRYGSEEAVRLATKELLREKLH